MHAACYHTRALRYFKATIICALSAFVVAVALYELGAFRALDAKLAAFMAWPGAPQTSRGGQYALALLLSLGIAWAAIDIARPALKSVIAAATLVEIFVAVWVSSVSGDFFSPFASATAVTTAFLLGLAFSRTEAGRRKAMLHQLIGDRVSTQNFAALLDSGEPLKFDGEIRECTVLVCEIFNHDQLLASLRVPDYVGMTNVFLRSASDLLVERGAYLDECDGESLRAVFGAPLPDPRHATNACQAALALATRLDVVNRECQDQWGHRFDFRIGINSGDMVMAAYGSARLGSFSVAGEPVEFARRLCAANTLYGSRILIGNGSFVLAEAGIEVRPMELIQRHPDNPSREEVYELAGMQDDFSPEDRARRDEFWKGVVFYREQKWDDALTAFKLAVELGGGDEPAEYYIRRIAQIRAGVPAPDWANSRA